MDKSKQAKQREVQKMLQDFQRNYEELEPLVLISIDRYNILVTYNVLSPEKLKKERRRVRYMSTSLKNMAMMIRNAHQDSKNWIEDAVN